MGLFSRKADWQKLAKKADKAVNQGDDSAAYYLYDEALETCPDVERANIEDRRRDCAGRLYRMNLEAARMLAESGDIGDAQTRYQLALDFATSGNERDEIEKILTGLAADALRREEEDQAEPSPGDEVDLDVFDLFNSLTAGLPEELADRYFEQGEEFRSAVVALHTGQPAQALEYLEQAADSRPNSILLYEYGTCLRALGRNHEAIDVWLRAEELDPHWLSIKLAITGACWAENRFDLAEEVLQRALDIDDESADVYWAVCRTALLTKTPEYGLEAAEVALSLHSDDHRITVLKGQLLEMAGRPEDAVDCYESVLQQTWQYDAMTDSLVFEQDAALLAARFYRRRGVNLDRAEDLYRGLLAVAPPRNRWRYELSLADVIIQAGKRDEADDLLAKVRHEIPETEVLGRMRAAELMGQQDRVEEMKAGLDDAQKAAWQEMHQRLWEDELAQDEEQGHRSR